MQYWIWLTWHLMPQPQETKDARYNLLPPESLTLIGVVASELLEGSLQVHYLGFLLSMHVSAPHHGSCILCESFFCKSSSIVVQLCVSQHWVYIYLLVSCIFWNLTRLSFVLDGCWKVRDSMLWQRALEQGKLRCSWQERDPMLWGVPEQEELRFSFHDYLYCCSYWQETDWMHREGAQYSYSLCMQ